MIMTTHFWTSTAIIQEQMHNPESFQKGRLQDSQAVDGQTQSREPVLSKAASWLGWPEPNTVFSSTDIVTSQTWQYWLQTCYYCKREIRMKLKSSNISEGRWESPQSLLSQAMRRWQDRSAGRRNSRSNGPASSSLSSRCSQNLALTPLILGLSTDENAVSTYAYFIFANKLQDPWRE